jgi:hypothetical protein
MSVLLAANCSKKSLPSSPDSSTTTPDIQETLTYIATAGATAQAAATQTMEIQQTSTAVAIVQQTANAQATYAATHGTSTPTINSTATAQMAGAIETATAQMAATIAYLAQADPTEQAAATQTQTAAIGNATATAVAQKTMNSLVTAVVVTCSYTYTPTNIIPPTITNTPTPSTTPAPLPINIYASIDYYNDENADYECYIDVEDANYNYIQNAVVTVKNVTKSRSFSTAWMYGSYSGPISGIDPGNTVEVDVYFSGVTYTASGVMPGNSNLSPDGNTLSWQYSENYVYVNIDDPSGNNIYYGQATGDSLDISSYYPLPGVEGEYSVAIDAANDNLPFAGGTSSNSSLNLEYDTSWDVNVVLVSKYPEPTPTPTPPTTAPVIIAEIFSSDLEGGFLVQDTVWVNGSDGNAVTDANVTIKNITAGTQINVPYVPEDEYEGVINGYYFLSGANCVAGDTYEFDVFAGGVTYTARVTAPVTSGNISTDCDTLTWSSNGNYNDVNEYMGFDKINVPGNSMDISSMYTSAETYEVNLFLANAYSNGSFQQGIAYSPAAFAGAAAPSLVAVGYEYLWDVEVTY